MKKIKSFFKQVLLKILQIFIQNEEELITYKNISYFFVSDRLNEFYSNSNVKLWLHETLQYNVYLGQILIK